MQCVKVGNKQCRSLRLWNLLCQELEKFWSGDRSALKVYAERGVQEYWMLDGRTQPLEVYRHQKACLRLVSTLFPQDTLEGIPVLQPSPLIFTTA
ncbi:MAG: hypothetical protein HC780_26920 [Leptolyngbyaceae cyanobacterium CSU_1_3]|nr:hypothetical protein [Leptolyngbyaceae cyanobacterium CSU_1_3]